MFESDCGELITRLRWAARSWFLTSWMKDRKTYPQDEGMLTTAQEQGKGQLPEANMSLGTEPDYPGNQLEKAGEMLWWDASAAGMVRPARQNGPA